MTTTRPRARPRRSSRAPHVGGGEDPACDQGPPHRPPRPVRVAEPWTSSCARPGGAARPCHLPKPGQEGGPEHDPTAAGRGSGAWPRKRGPRRLALIMLTSRRRVDAVIRSHRRLLAGHASAQGRAFRSSGRPMLPTRARRGGSQYRHPFPQTVGSASVPSVEL